MCHWKFSELLSLPPPPFLMAAFAQLPNIVPTEEEKEYHTTHGNQSMTILILDYQS